MRCQFRSIHGIAAPKDDDSQSSHAPLFFEMASISRPFFASLSMHTSSREHRPGMPLFTLSRASGPMTDTSLKVIRVKGDGRCMFRALSQGLARNHHRVLGAAAEEQEADQLRLAVAEALCRTPKRRNEFRDAVISLQAEDTIKNYCKRIKNPTFWGGEPELLVLSKMLQVPIYVYLSNEESGNGIGFIPIQKYGEQFSKSTKDRPKKRPVRLLYTGGNHYDLLVKP